MKTTTMTKGFSISPLLTFLLITGLTGLLCSAMVHMHREATHATGRVCAP